MGKHRHNFIDIAGKRFGRWMVLKQTEKRQSNGESFWLCRCNCGTLSMVSSYSLRSGGSKSYGCLRAEMRGYYISESKICKIEGCNKPIQAIGLCSMHYTRRRKGIKDMRPGPLPWKADDPRRKKDLPCTVDGCTKLIYAKGLCHTHYELNRRRGSLIYYKDIPKPKCSMEGCNDLATSLTSGLCQFHFHRRYNGTPLDRPKGIKGELNHNWNGGVAEYPNHYEMKKVRLEVLEEANYRCHYCGKYTKQIHHKDQTRSNHDKSNIVACCPSCNMQSERTKPRTSKYKRLYGKTLNELADILNICVKTVMIKHKQNKLTAYIRQDIQYYLSALL